MKAIDQARRSTEADAIDLERMIGPDTHRPGPARARLRAEEIPVWAVVGHLRAVAGTTDLADITDEAIAQGAADYEISVAAVQAALRYYRQHRGAIDALLEANAAAIA